MMVPVTKALVAYLRAWDGDGNMAELERTAGVPADTFARVVRGKVGMLTSRTTAALARGLGVTEEQLLLISLGRSAASSRQGDDQLPSEAQPVRMVRVFGLAQALGANVHHGDIVPESEWDLPEIPVPDDGKRYAAFRVEGESMAPRLTDGMVAIACPDAPLANGCVVVAKWDDTVAIKRYRRVGDTWHACRDQMERVWRWYVVARQSFSGCFGGSWGPSVCACHGDQAQTTASWQSAIRLLPLIHQRLQRVQIECCDFRDCLKRYQGPGYLAYCDPPYVWSSRKSGRYNHDLDDNDHRDLVEILLAYDGAVVLSGYPNPLYAPLEAHGWTKVEFACHCTITGRTAAQRKRPQDLKRTECVWRNPEALRRLAAAK